MATVFNSGWVEPTRKRSREPEEVMNVHGFDDHRDKRQQSLPFRTSPTQKRWSDPTAGSTTIKSSESSYGGERFPMSADKDADMMVDDGSYVHPSGPSHLNPATVDVSGRMPTPIHASFAAQVRGNNWQPPTRDAGALSESPLAHPQHFSATGSNQDPSVPRSLEDAHEWSVIQNRRLPSPISENGGEDMMPRSPGMVLDSSADHQRPYLPHMPHSTNPGAVGLLHPNIESNSHALATYPESDEMDAEANSTSAPSSPSPGRKIGHCRSKHTLNSWTLQPGMKKSFSIGYRTDCEKCRMKIPGHFNHIIVS